MNGRGLLVLVVFYIVNTTVILERFIGHLNRDFVGLQSGQITYEVLMDISFFLPLLIIFGMSAILLALSHKMAYVFCTLSGFLILWRAARMFQGVYIDLPLWQQYVHGGACLVIYALIGVFLFSMGTRKAFGWE